MWTIKCHIDKNSHSGMLINFTDLYICTRIFILRITRSINRNKMPSQLLDELQKFISHYRRGEASRGYSNRGRSRRRFERRGSPRPSEPSRRRRACHPAVSPACAGPPSPSCPSSTGSRRESRKNDPPHGKMMLRDAPFEG